MNRVVVDVVVTDSNGKPVRGLTKQDFSIFEEGGPHCKPKANRRFARRLYAAWGATARQVYCRAHIQALSPPQLATPAQMANLVDQPTYFHERQRKHPNKPLPLIEVQTYLVEHQVIARVLNLEVAAGAYDDEAAYSMATSKKHHRRVQAQVPRLRMRSLTLGTFAFSKSLTYR